MIGSLLAARVYAPLAAAAAAHAHVLAGELAARGAPIPASSLLAAIPDAIRTVRGGTG
jgi:NAD(P)H-hydrate repair Nnr-like enzyme with NAD(P)H-hydrate dehydratase domain